MARPRDDVDDAARPLRRLQPAHRFLGQDEGCAHVDVEQPVPQLDAGVLDRAAVGQAGGVDQAVDRAEALGRLCHDALARLGIGEIGARRTASGRTSLRCPWRRLRRAPASRPVMHSALAPLAAASRAIASPTPCVPPVTRMTLPSTRISLMRGPSAPAPSPAVRCDATSAPPRRARAPGGRPAAPTGIGFLVRTASTNAASSAR